MKDIAHHPKHIQKKVLQEARKTKRRKSRIRSKGEKMGEEEKLTRDRRNPEYEGYKFDPHHRKPRILKRINYH
jgi:hypothetical protein